MQRNSERKQEHDLEHPKNPDDKGFSIVINGREKKVKNEELTFDQVVGLTYSDPPSGDFICFTITYWNAGGKKPEGILVEGDSVKIRNGVVFNVTVTDKS